MMTGQIFKATFLALALCLPMVGLPQAGLAQDYPAAYQVTGVPKDDTLNIRSEPNATADILGQIGPFATAIEVLSLSQDGKWGRIGVPEGNGWVAMRYLEPTPPIDPYAVPRPFSCFGTEPFWSVSLYPRGAEYNSPDTGAVPMEVISEAVSPRGYMFKLREGLTLERTLIVSRGQCNDGMSDRTFGFSTHMFLESPEGNVAYTGCCTLDHH